MSNNEKFRALFESFGLSRNKFAKRVGISKKSVDSYLAPADASIYRNLPAQKLEFIELKTKELKRVSYCVVDFQWGGSK